MQIVSATPEHFAPILALNEGSVQVLSPLSHRRLETLHQNAAYHKVAVEAGEVVGVLLAFAERADHDSVNYRWFAERRTGLLYIDRVVVAPERRRGGVARRLYDDVIRAARAVGCRSLVCEIDVEPPNPASQRFHARLGFREVGTQRVEYEPGHPKQVSLQELRLDDVTD